MATTIDRTELAKRAVWLGSMIRVGRCEVCGARGIIELRTGDYLDEPTVECSDCFGDRMEMRYGSYFDEEAMREAAMDAWASRAYAGDPSNEPDAYELAAMDRAAREQEARDAQDDPNYGARLALEGFVLYAKADWAVRNA